MAKKTRPDAHHHPGIRQAGHVVDNARAVEPPAALLESLVTAWAELLVADFRRRQATRMDVATRKSELTAVSA